MRKTQPEGHKRQQKTKEEVMSREIVVQAIGVLVVLATIAVTVAAILYELSHA